MWFRPVPKKNADQGRVAVLLRPLPGHDDDEVMRSLRELGASEVELLAPGFISANVPASAREAAEQLARVEVKARKSMW